MYWIYSQVAVQVLSVCVLFLIATRKISVSNRLKKAKLELALLAIVLCFAGYQTLFNTIDFNATRTQLLKTFCLTQMFFLTLVLVDDGKKLKQLALVILISGTFQAAYGSLMTLSGIEYIWNKPKEAYVGVATGTFVNRNHLAGYLEMSLAVGIGLLLAGMQRSSAPTWRSWLRNWIEVLLGERALVRLCLTIMVIGLILTQSRMGNVAFFVSMSIGCFFGIFAFRRSSRNVARLFISLIAIDILLLGIFFGLDDLRKRVERTDLKEEQRIEVNYITAKTLISEKRVFGTGLGTWYTSFPEYRTRDITYNYRHAHSDLLQFPYEMGIGSLLLLGLWLTSMWHVIHAQVRRRSYFYRSIACGCGIGIVSISAHSLTDFNLQVYANSLTFMVLLAMANLSRHLETRNS